LPTFTPPTRSDWTFADGVGRRDPSARRFWSHYGAQPRGRSVLKIAGVWTTLDYPTTDQVNAATAIVNTQGERVPGAFIGGHEYDITDAVEAELIAAGYDTTTDVEFGGYVGGYIGGY
jgi:hypothetical protein